MSADDAGADAVARRPRDGARARHAAAEVRPVGAGPEPAAMLWDDAGDDPRGRAVPARAAGVDRFSGRRLHDRDRAAAAEGRAGVVRAAGAVEQSESLDPA